MVGLEDAGGMCTQLYVEEEEGVLKRLQFWGKAICAIVQARRRMNLFEMKKETSVKASGYGTPLCVEYFSQAEVS